jgi:HPr kinase/phosphorylase
MQIHASCAARDGMAVLLLGPSGCGKSDMTLRLIDRGFLLVADDRVEIDELVACAPPSLAGLLEVRGLGILRLPFLSRARLVLAVQLAPSPDRLPYPTLYRPLGLPQVSVDPQLVSAAQRVALALDCALGRVASLAGSFACKAA